MVRYEVFQRGAPANQFAIIEIWKDQQSYDAHAAAAHVKTFRQQIEPHLVAPIDERPYVALAAGPKDSAAIPRGATVAISHVDVVPPKKDDGIAALKALADPTRKDNGNLRFDVYQQKTRPNHFTVIEVWRNQKAVDAHETGPTPRISVRCWVPRPVRSTTSAGTRRFKKPAEHSAAVEKEPREPNGRGALFARAHLLASVGLPACLCLGAGLLEVHMLVDVVDPCERNKMMLAMRIGVGLRQLHLILTFKMVHGADVHPVGTENFHVFLDHHRCDHLLLHCFA